MINAQIGIIEAMVLVDDFIWFMPSEYNALYKVSLANGRVYYIDKVPDEDLLQKRLYSDMYWYDRKILFVPMSAKDVAVYDMENMKFTKIKLKECDNSNSLYKRNYKFSKCYGHKTFVYLMSVSYPAVVRIDLTDYSVKYYDEWIRFFDGKSLCNENVYFRNAFMWCGRIYLASSCSNLVVEFDVDKENFFCHEIGNDDEYFSDIALCQNTIYVSQLSGNEILILNQKDWKEIGRIDIGGKKVTSIDMKVWDNKVFYFPVNMFAVLKIENSNFTRIKIEETIEGCVIHKVICDDSSNCFFLTQKNNIVKYSMESEKIEIFQLDNNTFDINLWIGYVCSIEKENSQTLEYNAGNRIWNAIKEI